MDKSLLSKLREAFWYSGDIEYVSQDVRSGLGRFADWLAKGLTYDRPGESPVRYRSLCLSVRFAGLLDLWRVSTAFPELPDMLLPVLWCAMLLGLHPRMNRVANVVFLVGYALAVHAAFPFTWNHTWLGMYLFGGLALLPAGNTDQLKLSIAMARIVVLYSLIGAGIQKMIHGTYFLGSFMAMRADQFQDGPMGWLLFSPEDRAAFGNLEDMWVAERVALSSPMGVLAGNIVWFGEIVVGVMLLFPRLMTAAIVALVLLMVPIQLGTLEFGFLGLLLGMFPTYLGPRALRAWPVVMVIYVLVVAYIWVWTMWDTDVAPLFKAMGLK